MTVRSQIRPPAAIAPASASGQTPSVADQQLQQRNLELIKYIRAKTDRMLQVMGTVPLNPEELDDETLLTVDPIGIVADAFEQVLENLQSTKDELQAVFDSAGAGIIVVNSRFEVVAYNSFCQQAFFDGQGSVLGRNLRSLICADDEQQCIVEQILAVRRRVEQTNFRCADRHYHVVGTPLKGEGDQIDRIVLLYTDISERRAAAQEIERLAFFDCLTGLANRVLLKDRLSQMLSRAGRRSEQVAVLFIDLDRFKEVNDSLGHSSGDIMLQLIGERLCGTLRDSDTVGRLGGDEFVVLLEGVKARAGVVEVADKILHVLAQPVVLDQREVFTGGSIGIAVFPQDGRDVDTLFKNADTAMYYAKEQGRNTFSFYSADMHTVALELLTLSGYLRHAIDRDEFSLVYQPQVSLATGQVVGVEVLLRWQHPVLGEVPPEQFIPLAEDAGLILAIGVWVLNTACRQAMQWISQGLPAMRIAVNLSAKQFRDPELAHSVAQALQASGLPGHLLELELTEGMLIENLATTRSTLHALKAMGVGLAIDDFGTGYSSLSYLRHFPVDRLKIDKSFVHEINEQCGETTVIVEAIIALAHSLKLIVIAEGVESRGQIAFLKRHRCDELQGYYVSRPLVPASFEQLMRRLGSEPTFCLFHNE